MFKPNRLVASLAFLLTLMLTSTLAFAELSLPSKSPDLATTDSKSLGTIDGEFGLKAGEQVPAFSTKDHFGNAVSLDSLKENGTLLFVFYRGGWCPYCNRQIRSLTKAWPEFEKRDVTPVLVSADKPDGAAIAQRGYEIPFPVLSDPELFAHDAFKVSMQVDQAMFERLKSFNINLEKWSGKDHHKIAVSSAFLVDKSGKVLWSHSDLDYKKRPSVEQLLTVIDGMSQK